MPSPGWLHYSSLDLLAAWHPEFSFMVHRHIGALATKMGAMLGCQEIGPEHLQVVSVARVPAEQGLASG